MNVNETRPETETKTEPRQHDDDHSPPKHDAKRTIMVVCGFVAALAMLIGLNMK